jgi:hypothetical protein
MLSSALTDLCFGELDVGARLLLGERSLQKFKSAHVHMHFYTDHTYESEVWLDDAEIGEQSLCLVVLDRWVHDNVVAWDPVDRGCDPVLVACL